MQRAFLFILVVLGTPAATVGQTAPSESQTLQALLTEVRGLRHDLQVSLTRVESAQILLSRLQIQQVAVTRASQHVDETRSKLAEVQLVQKAEAAKVASLQERLSEDPEHREDIQLSLNHAQSDLTAATDLAQQRQATETEAEQQLQTEQDKLKKLEAQLDELLNDVTTLGGQSNRVPR
jgi:chromosome segregation ATPase